MPMVVQTPRNKAFLVVVQTREAAAPFEDAHAEMKELCLSALMKVTGSSRANVPDPSPRYFVREGKLAQINSDAKKCGANVILFNIDLSPAQARNIESLLKIPVMDRTGLILQIFGRRAKTKEGKLQVELAHLNYMLPRLGGLGRVMSRLGAGIGSRGPGEQELEHDRRKIRRRIERVQDELEQVKKHRKLIRDARRRKNFTTVALIGYTNAGKSTLLNSLSGAKTYVEDKMFATLDPLTRIQSINGRTDLLLIDTVGFLRNLPHSLVKAFHATLEEVVEADVLVHVLDVSSPNAEEQLQAVKEVLKEIKASQKPVVLALNKADVLPPSKRSFVQTLWPEGVLISAKTGEGLDVLVKEVSAEKEVFDKQPGLPDSG